MTAKFIENVVFAVSSSGDAWVAMKLLYEAYERDHVISRDRFLSYRNILDGVIDRYELLSSSQSF